MEFEQFRFRRRRSFFGFGGRFALLYGLVTVFMGLFLGFIFCFSIFDGDWVWLLELDLGFARNWFGCILDLGRT